MTLDIFHVIIFDSIIFYDVENQNIQTSHGKSSAKQIPNKLLLAK